MGISYDVEQDEPGVDHETGVKAIPPSPVTIPKAPQSILEQQEDPYKQVFGVDGNAAMFQEFRTKLARMEAESKSMLGM